MSETALAIAEDVAEPNLAATAEEERPIFSGNEIGRVTQVGIPLVQVTLSIQELEDLYDQNRDLDFLPVADGDDIVGYIMRDVLKARLGENQYARALHTRPGRTVDRIMEKKVRVLDCRLALDQASDELMARDEEVLYQPTVVSRHGRYYGICTLRNILAGITYYNQIDLNSCREAQRKALKMPEIRTDQLSFGHHIKQIGGLGGDLTYSFQVTDYLHFFMLADVSGKGLKASNMVLSIVTSLDTMFTLTKKKLKKFDGTPKITPLMKKLNRIILRSTPDDMYCTAACFFIDLRNLVLQYFDFAHNTVFIKRRSLVIDLPKSNFTGDLPPFLGMSPDLELKPLVLKLRPKDLIFCYSDGLSEAKNQQKDEFGEDRIRDILRSKNYFMPDDLIEDTLGRLEIFRDGYRQTDDLSMMAIKIH